MQDGQSALPQQIIMPVMRRVAGDGHSLRAGLFQRGDSAKHVWQR